MLPTVWNQDLVLDLFATGARWAPRGMPDEYRALARDLNQRRIAVEVVEYTRVDEPPVTTLPSLERLAWAYSFSGTGGARHSELKWWAWNWLRDQGEPHPQFEQPVGYGIADVVAPRIGYVVECGDTAPGNVGRSLFDYGHNGFVLFPFCSQRGPCSAFLFRVAEHSHKPRETIDEPTRLNQGRSPALRAYPNNPAARRAMRAQAKCRKAM